ncbi:Exodeoxyribonuclease I [hydrothermal vent metagenome]|uniref:Exodeoxyribonuclease I n=1 Tax=hydrothermal vent metagenome TaxID=652676 RepID=A0A3B0YUF5_9ZZZZ
MASKTNTFYWYDYETFGLNPMTDRLAQFAGVRTDEDFNVIGDPLTLYCKPADDFLPQPQSVMITGITPQKTQAEGVSESEFITRINAEFSKPNTCVLGYNSIRFDDEFTRYSLYRNFHDPYAREWRNGCSRWDLVDVVRMTRALRPEGIVWPSYEDGRPSLRLEDLSKANDIEHASAHDALSDVYATIAMGKLIKDKQPKLFDYAYKNKAKNKVLTQLNMASAKPVLHVSGMYPTEQGNMAVVVPIAMHPSNKNGIIVFDLSHDPEILYRLNAKQIHHRLFTSAADLEKEGLERIPLKTVLVNKSPIIAPLGTLNGEASRRFKIDLMRCKMNFDFIRVQPSLNNKMHKVFSMTEYAKHTNVDYMLYSGSFFSEKDRAEMDEIHSLTPEDLASHQPVFADDRLTEMFFRYRARNWPETLSVEDKKKWNEYRQAQFNKPDNGQLSMDDYFKEIAELRKTPERTEPEFKLLDELEHYGKQLVT